MSEKKTGIDQSLIRDLANILNETDLTEIEVEQNDLRIRVSRAGTPHYVQAAAPAPVAAAPAPAQAPALSPAETARTSKNAVTAPMVGTCYLCPAPGSPPFVEIGSTVKEGQTLLIIEAMKTMNQIPAPRSGKITEIFAEDGQPVEYGQPLFVIE
jgi:acetyl-CoA carboxylase biotin carboxyl carrier protein